MVGLIKNKHLLSGLKLLTLFTVYFLTAKFGLSFDAVSGFATLLWIPSGISLFFLLFFGYSLWPAITIAAFLVNLTTGANPAVALGIGIGNTLEAVIGTYLLKQTGFRPSLERLRDVLLLILLVAPLSAIVSATIGVSSLFLGHTIEPTAYTSTWKAWVVGDMISIIIVTPFLSIWQTTTPFYLNIKKVGEFFVLFSFTVLMAMIVFAGLFSVFPARSPITYLMFPPLLWVSLRFGQRGTVTTVFVLSLFAIIQTLHGFGPFASGRVSDRLFLLQSFIGVIGLTSMAIAAIDAERKKFDARKDEFISLASHELKTPLTTIKLFNQMLQNIFSKKSLKKEAYYVERTNTQINQLELLIDDLLDVSKIQRGKMEFNREHFLLQQRVVETVQIIQLTTATHKFIVNDKINSKETVYADKDRISQVLINLFTNAIKYSPDAKKIVVRIFLKKNSIVVSVRDFGIGVEPKAQKKLFQRYYRAHDSTNQTVPGLGIGLYIAHEIVKRSGGNMWLESKIGKGSTFYFSLPLEKADKQYSISMSDYIRKIIEKDHHRE